MTTKDDLQKISKTAANALTGTLVTDEEAISISTILDKDERGLTPEIANVILQLRLCRTLEYLTSQVRDLAATTK